MKITHSAMLNTTRVQPPHKFSAVKDADARYSTLALCMIFVILVSVAAKKNQNICRLWYFPGKH